MALFLRNTTQHFAPTRNPSPRPAGYLPTHYARLREPRCHQLQHHALPLPMRFTGWGRTQKGAPVAYYRCPVCARTEAWGPDRMTGQPRPIFVASN